MPESFVSAFLLLLLVLDPLGNAVPFNAFTAKLPPSRRRIVILRECCFGTLVLVGTALFGSCALRYTGIRPMTLGITGGVTLFLIGLRMLFQGDCGMESDADRGEREPFIVPMAVPLFAGPSSIALTVLNAGPGAANRWMWAAGMLAACAVTTLFLSCSEPILRRLGGKAVAAMSRLMGLVLTAVAVQMVLDGFGHYWATLPPR